MSDNDSSDDDRKHADSDDEGVDESKEQFQGAKKAFLAMGRRDIEFDVPDDVWMSERKCLLMVLEARMLLREMVEYKLKLQRMASGNLTVAEIQNLLALNAEDNDDADFISVFPAGGGHLYAIFGGPFCLFGAQTLTSKRLPTAEIQELKRQLVKEVRRNHALERELAKLDGRIALLIQNRTSIQEIDRERNKKKKKQEEPENQGPVEDFSHDKKKMELYSNLFYCLQVEPRYLAKLAYVIPQDKTDSFLDTMLLTLFGDAFSPREEYLILNVFKHAMEYEIAHIKSPQELKEADSIVPKMVLTYNRRKQGVEYLKNTLTGVLKEMMLKEYNFELKAQTIYQKIVNDMEVKSGKKSKMKRDVTEEEAAADPNVKSILTQRAKELEEVVQLFLDKILGSMNSLPYGLRLISAQIRRLILDKFPKTKPDEIWPIIGYFTYYRFINLAVVQPDTFDIGGRDLSLTVRKNLVVVGKVLQTLFRLDTFKDKEELAPMNPWLQAQRRAVTEYFSDLIDVPPPEDYLQVNQYMELTQRSKPLIIIAMREIVETHRLIKDCVGQITKGAEDPLAIIAKELGEVPNLGRDLGDREVQLNLENRFKDTMEDEIKPGAHTYAETKELIIQVLKQIPIKAGAPQTLASIINDAGKFAKDSNNKALAKTVNKILKNFAKLEETNMITPKDNYTSLLKDVALEVTNRAERREQQQKEIARLQATLKNLKKHQEFMNDQISEFEKYLDSCRKNSAARIKLKNKPVKFPYKDLVKKGVIIDSEVPDLTKFFISMPEAGVFDIEAKIAGMSVGKMQLELEDLLEKKENNQLRLELDQVTLNVPSTIFLINKYFLS